MPNQPAVIEPGIELRYEDFIRPLMPYCILLDQEKIVFRLPRHLLHGGWDMKFILSFFKELQLETDMQQKPLTRDSMFVEYEFGHFQTATLWFKQRLRIANANDKLVLWKRGMEIQQLEKELLL